jgi:hypothetical protein
MFQTFALFLTGKQARLACASMAEAAGVSVFRWGYRLHGKCFAKFLSVAVLLPPFTVAPFPAGRVFKGRRDAQPSPVRVG